MKKGLYCKLFTVGIIILFFVVCINPVQCNNSTIENVIINPTISRVTIYVDDNNTEGPWDGTQQHPYQFIQDGVNASSNRDTVFVYSGIYYENIVVDKSVKLIGENMNTTFIDGNYYGIVINISVDRVTISGFNIQHCGEWWAGMVIYSNNNVISDNLFTNLRSGVIVGNDCFGNLIINNIFDQISWIAVGFGNSRNNIVSKNFITNSSCGVSIWGGYFNYVFLNSIKDIDCNGIEIESSGLNRISSNNIENCDDNGISISISPQTYYNTGLVVYNSIINNNIVNNTRGIDLAFALFTMIKKNNFIGNHEGGNAEFFNSFITRWKDNYWDDWTGSGWYKIKGELLILIIYYLKELYNYDKSPALEPFDIEV